MSHFRENAYPPSMMLLILPNHFTRRTLEMVRCMELYKFLKETLDHFVMVSNPLKAAIKSQSRSTSDFIG